MKDATATTADGNRRSPPFWLVQLTGWSIYGLTVFIAFLAVLQPGRSVLRLLVVKVVKALTGCLLTWLLRWLYQRLWRRSLSFRLLGLAAVIASPCFGIIWVLSYQLTLALLYGTPINWTASPGDALDFIYVMFGWTALYFGIKYWREWEAERDRALQATNLAQQAQLAMLRYQLNPHFLFNALNSIRASIDEDRERAKRMITEFSEFLRYSLLKGDTETITLREEIEAIRNYLAIEKIRFEEKLDVIIAVEPAAEAHRLPAFLIHPLIENAIKHGFTSESVTAATPLRLRLSVRQHDGTLRIEVANTGRWLTEESPPNGTRVGLRNIRQRLAQVYPHRSRFETSEADGWAQAVIEIRAEEGDPT